MLEVWNYGNGRKLDLNNWANDWNAHYRFLAVRNSSGKGGVGLPLGNLTSQLLVDIYMNESDQYMKHVLKQKYYIRYADDFVVFSTDKIQLAEILRYIAVFLSEKLRLQIHPDKLFIKTIASGVDYLDWVHFPNHRVLRTSTKRRMFRRLADNPKEETIASYLGLLKHGNTFRLSKLIMTGLSDSNARNVERLILTGMSRSAD